MSTCVAKGKGQFTVVGVIPARGGSQGVSRKALRDLGGMPLVVHTVRAALASPSLDHVVVSTDDPEIADVAMCYGAFVPALRPPELATDQASLNDALNWTLDLLREKHGIQANVLVTLMPTYPFRRPGLIDRVVAKLIDRRGAFVSAWSVLRSRPEEWLEPASSRALHPVITGDLREAIVGGKVDVYRACGSVNAQWHQPRCSNADWVLTGWRGVVLRGREGIDVDEIGDLQQARAAWEAGDAESTAPSRAPSEVKPRPDLDVQIVLPAPHLLSDGEDPWGWVEAGRQLAGRISSRPPIVVEASRRGPKTTSHHGAPPGVRGMLGVARYIESQAGHGLVPSGTRTLVLDTRIPLLNLGQARAAVEQLETREVPFRMGLRPVADHPALAVVVENGKGRLLISRPESGGSVRRQDLPAVFEPAGFVAWMAGSLPAEVPVKGIDPSLAETLAEPEEGPAVPVVEKDPAGRRPLREDRPSRQEVRL